jgi:hypothetical protein
MMSKIIDNITKWPPDIIILFYLNPAFNINNNNK